MTALLIDEVREAADRYEAWLVLGNPCELCGEYEDCSSCSVLFEYEIAMVLLIAAAATLEGFDVHSTDTLVRAANSMVNLNWMIRYGEG